MVEAKLIETKQTVSQQVDDNVSDMKNYLSESLEILKNGLQMEADRHITEAWEVCKGYGAVSEVKINSHEGKTEIFQRAKMLKEIQSFKRIFIAPDITRQQQAVDKELRLKLTEFREGMNLMPK